MLVSLKNIRDFPIGIDLYKISYDFTIRMIVIWVYCSIVLSQRQYITQISLFALLLMDLAHYL